MLSLFAAVLFAWVAMSDIARAVNIETKHLQQIRYCEQLSFDQPSDRLGERVEETENTDDAEGLLGAALPLVSEILGQMSLAPGSTRFSNNIPPVFLSHLAMGAKNLVMRPTPSPIQFL